MMVIPPRIEHLTDQLVYVKHNLPDSLIEELMERQAKKERATNRVSQLDPSSPDGVSNQDTLRLKNRISGVTVGTSRIGRWKHRIEISSPPIYGERFYWREVVDQGEVDDKLTYMMNIVNNAKVKILAAFLSKPDAMPLRTFRHGLSSNGSAFYFDELDMLKAWQSLEADRDEHIDDIVEHLSLLNGTIELKNVGGGYGFRELWLVHLGMHEIHMEIKSAIEEGTDMGKGGEEMVWWAIEGSADKLKGLAVSLNRSRNYVVYDTPRRIYLRIQNSEKQFVRDHTSDHNLSAKRIHDEPQHEQAPCEKYVTDLALHTEGGGGRGQKKCRSCQTLMQNAYKATISEATNTAVEEAVMAPKTRQLRPAGTSPALVPANGRAKEDEEWAAQNGDVIIVQGPTKGIDPLDFATLAKENRRVANELLARASWFEETADKYDALLRPSPAVQQAEEALKAAQANEESERKSQIEALQKLLTDGPPTSAD
jgi:hypothetical protein